MDQGSGPNRRVTSASRRRCRELRLCSNAVSRVAGQGWKPVCWHSAVAAVQQAGRRSVHRRPGTICRDATEEGAADGRRRNDQLRRYPASPNPHAAGREEWWPCRALRRLARHGTECRLQEHPCLEGAVARAWLPFLGAPICPRRSAWRERAAAQADVQCLQPENTQPSATDHRRALAHWWASEG